MTSFCFSGKSAEDALVRHLRFKRGLLACKEVALGLGIADVLAIDLTKEEIYEYEFKRSMHDLGVLEFKKIKYQVNSKKPNRFYFVIDHKLWKNAEMFLTLIPNVGVITFRKNQNHFDFTTVKIVKSQKENTYDFKNACSKFLLRLSSAYANLLGETEK